MFYAQKMFIKIDSENAFLIAMNNNKKKTTKQPTNRVLVFEI